MSRFHFSVSAFVIILFVLTVNSCQEVQDKQTFKNPEEIVNPNGDSELAIVMRYIHFEANKVGRELEAGNEPDLTALKELAARLTTSVPTDSNVLDEAYYSFSQGLQEKVNKMNSEESVTIFNEMVQTCVACHKNTCPGPIKKIQKLKIKS